MTYVKIFEESNYDDLEYSINAYARRCNEEIKSISIQGCSAAVIFEERSDTE